MFKYTVTAIALMILLSCDQNTPLIKYAPKSSQEQALKNVLLEFQEGVLNKDSKKVENLIHEKASIMIDRKLLSKEEYAKILPERLAENSYIALGKPRMTISGDKAEIKIYMTRGDNNFLIIFNMKLENNKWYILSWKY
ncbi:MAG: hypothetical protein EHM85_15545 [Desulfobacteraceae bacterium]|nr:MAG: hypothetical protein EHM85_15545 [Desulfobacteraceae bacterium]